MSVSIETLALEHFREWVEESGVTEQITRLNVQSIDDPFELKQKLNYKPDQRWRQYPHGAGWWVSGIDPETGEPTHQGGQFKPDKPIPILENGQPVYRSDGTPKVKKYDSPAGYEAQPLFLNPGIPNYWLNVIEDVFKPIVLTEGAKKAGAGLAIDLPTISIPGVHNGQLKGRLKTKLKQFCRVGRRVYLAFDADWVTNPMVASALDRLGRIISQWGAVVYVVNLPPASKGMDDFIVANGADAFKQLLEQAWTLEEWRDQLHNSPVPNRKPRNDWEAEKNVNQEVQEALYGDKPWVCIEDVLYHWTGTHYIPSPDSIERRRIREFLASYAVEVSRGGETRRVYKYATPGHVNQALEWVKQGFAIDPNTVNPPGLNCTNGVLQIIWNGQTPAWKLEDHNPDKIYLYEPLAQYDPTANTPECDQLLSCLELPQQDLFLKTIAAALDLQGVRARRGRAVRALLLKGDGANGKDTLRESISALFGRHGMTACSFADCKQYDEGRKFPLAKLELSRINWSSENTDSLALDKLQVLKAIITGDPLDVERKGKDDFSITPKCVLLFNVNETPSITAALEAIQSRYGILKFAKTYKSNPDLTRGELQADPRFKHDTLFLQERVLSSLLNRILQALVDLMRDGIDYSVIDHAIEEAREESSHLYIFARECGLVYDPNGQVYVGEIWDGLKAWYIENGTLTIEVNEKTGKEKAIWIDQASRFDPNVKGAHQLVARLQKLYPKIQRGKRTNGQGIPLFGLRFVDKPDLSNFAVSEASVITQRSYSEATKLPQKPDGEPTSEKSDPASQNPPRNFKNAEIENLNFPAPNDPTGSLLTEIPPEQEIQPKLVASLELHCGITEASLPAKIDKTGLYSPQGLNKEETYVYTGSRFLVYQGKPLTLREQMGEYACFWTPDQAITTWLLITDIRRATADDFRSTETPTAEDLHQRTGAKGAETKGPGT